MDSYLWLRFLHVIGAAVLLGTGAGIAFFMLAAHRSRDAAVVARVAAIAVSADFVFTATAVVLQPITGGLLMVKAGHAPTEGWLVAAMTLYVATGCLWLPVIFIQMRMRDLAGAAAASGAELPVRYHRLFRAWVICGIPAFAAVLAILWLMIARPRLF